MESSRGRAGISISGTVIAIRKEAKILLPNRRGEKQLLRGNMEEGKCFRVNPHDETSFYVKELSSKIHSIDAEFGERERIPIEL